MADQTERLELATVKAEIASNIVSRFSNDPVEADPIPTDSGDIQNLKQVAAEIKADGQAAVDAAVAEGVVDLAGSVASSQEAADRSESASTLAAAFSNPFPSIADGLANTSGSGATNRFFSVPGAGGTLASAYRNESGAAVKIGEAPSASVVSESLAISSQTRERLEFHSAESDSVPLVMRKVVDKYFIDLGVDADTGNIIANFDEADPGLFGALKYRTSESFASSRLIEQETPLIPIFVTTVNGRRFNAVAYHSSEGGLYVDGQKIGASATDSVADTVIPITELHCPLLQASVRYGIRGCGQSHAAGNGAVPVLSTAPRYTSWTFDNGLRADIPSTTKAALYEGVAGLSVEESPASAGCKYLSEGVVASAGKFPDLFYSIPAIGGADLNLLHSYLYRFRDQVTASKTITESDGLAYKELPCLFTHGGQDAAVGTTYEYYKSKLTELAVLYRNHVRLRTGDASYNYPLILFPSTTNVTTSNAIVSRAMVDLSIENPDQFMLGSPIYHIPTIGDNIHYTNVGSNHLGHLHARALTQMLVGRQRPSHQRMLSATKQNSYVIIETTMKPEIDVTNLLLTTGWGFKVTDALGNNLVTGCSIVNSKIWLSTERAISGEATVRYAMDYRSPSSKIIGGATGNIRAVSSDTYKLEGVAQRLDYWMFAYELPIIVLEDV